MDLKLTLEEDIRRCAAVMRDGGVVLYPTDTVWGIGCDATSSEAVKKVFAIKRRSDAKALITLVDGEAMLERYVEEVPEVAYQLLECALSPITIVYDRGKGVAPELLGEDGSIGIRVTSEIYSNRLCKELRKPLVSTSANISGQPAPGIFRDISGEILDSVDYVACYRRNDTSPSRPSSVIKLSVSGEIRILRR